MSENEHAVAWIRAAQAGDRLALAKLLALHHPRLAARIASRLDPGLKGRTSPEDVLQEVYLQVFRGIFDFEERGPDSFVNWVLTIIDRKLIDLHRAAHRRKRDVGREKQQVVERDDSFVDLLDCVYRDTATPSRVVRYDEAVGALLVCLGALPESQQQVIEWRFLRGLPIVEVARRLDRSEGAVVALTQRALRSLREQMDQRGDFTRGR